MIKAVARYGQVALFLNRLCPESSGRGAKRESTYILLRVNVINMIDRLRLAQGSSPLTSGWFGRAQNRCQVSQIDRIFVYELAGNGCQHYVLWVRHWSAPI